MASSGFTTSSIASYNAKYFDVYDSSSSPLTWNKRILGDATGEMGPIGTNSSAWYINSWYGDYGYFLDSATNTWFSRGGRAEYNKQSGLFSFHIHQGVASNVSGTRIILTP